MEFGFKLLPDIAIYTLSLGPKADTRFRVPRRVEGRVDRVGEVAVSRGDVVREHRRDGLSEVDPL